MALRSVALVAALPAAVLATILACGSGSGPMVTNAAGGPDNPGTSRDNPPSPRDDPSGSSGSGGCITCDVVYNCAGGNAQGGPSAVELMGSDCTPANIAYICSGALFGATSCTGGGGGSFTCGMVTCTPQVQMPPPPVDSGGSSSGGGSGSGGEGGGSSSGAEAGDDSSID